MQNDKDLQNQEDQNEIKLLKENINEIEKENQEKINILKKDNTASNISILKDNNLLDNANGNNKMENFQKKEDGIKNYFKSKVNGNTQELKSNNRKFKLGERRNIFLGNKKDKKVEIKRKNFNSNKLNSSEKEEKMRNGLFNDKKRNEKEKKENDINFKKLNEEKLEKKKMKMQKKMMRILY